MIRPVLLGYRADRSNETESNPEVIMRHKVRDAVLFALPFLIIYIVFLVFPIFYGGFLSFFDWNILSVRKFIGFENYMTVISDEDFRRSLFNTVKFVLMSTPSIIAAGFFMALMTIRAGKLNRTAEAVFFMPYVFSTTVVGTLWAWLFQKNYGLFNQIGKTMGFPPVGWLSDPRLALPSIVVATLWWTAGFNMILFSAGMKQIPEEVYESARMDGAGNFTILTRITIPLLRETGVLVLVLQIIASFKVFGQSYVMTGGGPYGTTRVLVQYMYETGFNYFKLGYASAMSVVLFLVVLAVSAIQFAIFKEKRR